MKLLQKRRKTFLITYKIISDLRIKTRLFLLLITVSSSTLAQGNKENNFGFHLGASVYQDFEIKIPDKYYFGTNLEFGLDFTHYYDRSRFWKTGVNYTFFKSPL